MTDGLTESQAATMRLKSISPRRSSCLAEESLQTGDLIDPPEDNLESIFECAKKLARTYGYSGGCGIDI